MTEIEKCSDEEVVVLVRQKDKELFSEIIRRYQEKLMRYVTYLVGDYHKASDIVQETFIKAYINLNGFNVRRKFSSWLYRIAHNEAMNILKKSKKQIPITETTDFDSGIDLEEDLVKKELVEDTQNCLQQLPVIYREPLSLYYLENKTYDEIGDILRIPTGTVGTRINRARIIMKNICQK